MLNLHRDIVEISGEKRRFITLWRFTTRGQFMDGDKMGWSGLNKSVNLCENVNVKHLVCNALSIYRLSISLNDKLLTTWKHISIITCNIINEFVQKHWSQQYKKLSVKLNTQTSIF